MWVEPRAVTPVRRLGLADQKLLPQRVEGMYRPYTFEGGHLFG